MWSLSGLKFDLIWQRVVFLTPLSRDCTRTQTEILQRTKTCCSKTSFFLLLHCISLYIPNWWEFSRRKHRTDVCFNREKKLTCGTALIPISLNCSLSRNCKTCELTWRLIVPWYERAQSRTGRELFKEMLFFLTKNARNTRVFHFSHACSWWNYMFATLKLDFLLLHFSNTDKSLQQSHFSHLLAKKFTRKQLQMVTKSCSTVEQPPARCLSPHRLNPSLSFSIRVFSLLFTF